MKFNMNINKETGNLDFCGDSEKLRYKKFLVYDYNEKKHLYTMDLYKKKNKRSLNQNNTLHGWNLILANESGLCVDEMKRETKRRCNLGDWVEFDGRQKFNPLSSARFTVEQCKIFMAEQEKIAIFLNVTLPYT